MNATSITHSTSPTGTTDASGAGVATGRASASTRRCPDIPHQAWYAGASSDEVGRSPLARTVLGERIVLYRTSDGSAVALEDRCCHKPVPLSEGHLDGDDIIAGYTGFRYAPSGQCVEVPTQDSVPFGASVRSYPVVDDGSFVWLWMGEPNLASRRPVPAAPWLLDDGWVSFGSAQTVQASIRLLWDNFADITHIAYLQPEIAPRPLLTGTPPALELTVSETGMAFSRTYPPAPVVDWHGHLMGVDANGSYVQREEGELVTPGLWVDRWHVEVPDQGETSPGDRSFVFTHALTPIDETSTRHVWRVSRNFASSAAATGTLMAIMDAYYRRVAQALESMQQVITDDGARPDVLVAADAGAVQVRRIMDRLVADETGTG